MTTEFSIRKATVKDADNLSALSYHTWLDTYAKDGVRSSYSQYLQANLLPSNFVTMLENPACSFLVAENNKSLIGFIGLEQQSICPCDDRCTVEITTFYIFKRFANCGVGSRLLNAALTECKNNDQRSIWLSTNHENEIAIRFYQKHGFSIVGTLMFQLEDGEHPNHILMKEI